MTRELVERMLTDPSSPVMAGGRRPRPVQARYAARVFDGLSGDFPVSLIEAETGVGKTIGYVIAALAHAARSGDRVVISTHSIALQSQIMRALEDLGPAMAKAYGRPVTVRKRVGRRNLLCEKRFEEGVNALLDQRAKLSDEERAVIDETYAFFEEAGEPHTVQGLEEHLETRLGDDLISRPVPFSEFRVRAADRNHPAYQRMARSGDAADVLVINHALVATDLLLKGRVLSLTGETPDGRRTRLVIDEAERLHDAIESLLTARTPFCEVRSLLESFKDRENAHPDHDKLMTKLEELADRLRTRARSLITPLAGAGTGLVLNRCMPELRKIRGGTKALKDMIPLLDEARKAILEVAGPDEDDALEVAEELGAAVNAISTVIDGDKPGGEVVFYWSEKLMRPGVSTRRIEAQYIARRLWTETNADFRAVMTSATMSTEGQGTLMEDFCKEIGLKVDTLRNDVIRDRISPEVFGDMRFMTVNQAQLPDVTLPRGKDDEVPPLNLAHAHAMLELAFRLSEKGERVLVPVPSYRDVHLYRRLKDEIFTDERGDRVLLDGPGRRDAWRRFSDAPGSILISPAVWSGLDLPGLVRHILIPRIPLPPTSLIKDGLYEIYLRSRGWSEEQIQGHRFKKLRAKARIKLKQAFGRGIRGENDHTTIWIGDPRWPFPPDIPRQRKVNSKVGTGMDAAVPARFRDAHREMGVLDLRGREDRDPDPA